MSPRNLWTADLGDCPVDLAWSPDGSHLAAASIAGPVALFAHEGKGKLLRTLPGHPPGALSLSWSGDSRLLATSGQEPVIRLWNIADGSAHLALPISTGAKWCARVALSPRSGRIAAAAGKHLHLWTADGSPILPVPQPHTSTITDLHWHPRRDLLASSAYGLAHILDLDAKPGDPGRGLEYPSSLLSVRWNQNATFIAAGCQDNSIRFWDWPQAQEYRMSGYLSKVRDLSWADNSRLLATAGGNVVIVWDFSDGPPVNQTPFQLDSRSDSLLSALAFRPRATLLAAGDDDGLLSLWEPAQEDAPLARLNLKSGIEKLAWHPTDPLLAVATNNGRLTLLQLPAQTPAKGSKTR